MRLKKTKGYNWRFFKAGGAYQPLIERGSDIAAVGELDMKLWAALSCPTRGLYFDEKTLDFMDADKDGRIRRAGIPNSRRLFKVVRQNVIERLRDLVVKARF